MRRAGLLALLLALLAAAPAHAAFPGKNGKIAFVSTGDGNAEIYTINSDGSNPSRLTNDPGADCAPHWSPDGKKIAFLSNRDGPAGHNYCHFGQDLRLFVMNADGSGVTELAADLIVQSSPTWSPDGQKIAFINPPKLYTINADGSDRASIYVGRLEYPAWSPDGQKIALDYDPCFPDPNPCGKAIGTVRPDGTGFTDLTSPPGDQIAPDWSPDGSMIAWDEGDLVNIMNSDGSNQHALPRHASDDFPAWSPDGTKIVFNSGGSPYGGCPSSCSQIYTINPDGTGLAPMTSLGGDNIQPDWQPLPINGYPRPKGATPFQTYLTVAYKPCASPNSQHGSPLAALSCSPPQQASDFLTVGTLDSNGQKANAIGSVRYDVKPGTASNPADDADVKMNISIKDVRLKDLSDYAGELQVTSARRITDKLNTPAPDGTMQAATTQDTPFSVTVPCAPTTSDTTIGSLCAIATTADAIVPGQVTENARSNWELGQVRVYDGGADQDADTTADNTLFMDEGVFVP